ncbi:MAG: copper resistance protein CopC [Gemmatimonadota bacterium]
MRAAIVLVAALAPRASAAAGAGEATRVARAPAASVHAHLVSSLPAEGDTLATLPREVRLVFSEPIEDSFSEIVLTGWDGRRLPLAPHRDPADVRALAAALPALAPGGWRVTWRIVSADGHPVAGSYAFYVRRVAGPDAAAVDAGHVHGGVAAADRALAPAPDAPAGGHRAHGSPAGETGEPPVAAAILRALGLGASMALAGVLGLLTWVVPGPPGRLDRLAWVLAIVTPLLLAADLLLWLQHASPARGLTAEGLQAALATRSGAVGGLRIALALLALWALGLARRRAPAAGIGLGAVLLTALTGHPAAIQPALAVPAKAIHLLAVTLWLGGLLVLLLAERTDERFREDALRVSGLALGAVLAIAASGVLQTLLFLPSPMDLVRSTYGLLALGKVAGLGVLMAYGAVNRYRILPALRAGGEPATLRRSVRGETLVMAAVIVLAAFLAYVPPPSDSGASAQATRDPAVEPGR